LGGNFNGHIQFTNQWALHSGLNLNSETYDPSQLRGGPAMLIPGSKSFWCFIESDTRKKLSFQYQGQHSRSNFHSASSDFYSPIIRYQPLNTLEILLAPSYTVVKNELQYVDEQAYLNDPRYLLGNIHQKIFSVSARINVNIRPNLTIEYWGQPFVTSGNYKDLKMVTHPKSNEYTERFHIYDAQQLSAPNADNYYLVDENRDGKVDYQFENPNFNFNEFLSNMVLRWEYLPGSTLYLVWSQSRRYESTSGDFDFSNNISELYSHEKPNNTFMLKLSYRIAVH
jgi:hypothetical protein